MNLKERYSYLKLLQVNYRRAAKKEKGRIIGEVVKNLGYHPTYAAERLSKSIKFDLRRKTVKSRARVSSYLPIVKPLKKIWFISNYLCPERLQPYIPELVRVLEEQKEIKVTQKQKELLLRVSRATVARLLIPIRQKIFGKGKSTTKPGSLLKHQVPIRTYTDWDNNTPGFLEIDLVALCGGSLRGDYVNILDVVDIATCWSELQGFMGKSQFFTTLSLDEIEKRLPFPIKGIDSDNDAPFINAHFVIYCEKKQITFTRCRPYKKQDQAHIEQKNYSVVRKYFGYRRYETQKQLGMINKICSLISLYHNFFQPVMRLKEKIRIGSKIRRKYDIPKTPYQRVLDSSCVPEETKLKLKIKYKTLGPKELLIQIIRLIDKL